MLNSSRFYFRTLITTLVGAVKVGIVFAIVISALYFVGPLVVEDFDLIPRLQKMPLSYVVFGGFLLVLGYITSKKKRSYYAFKDVISNNSTFRKHIKIDMKRRVKTLKFRLKKEGKSKPKK